MKTVLPGIVLGIVLSTVLIFGSRALASDTLPLRLHDLEAWAIHLR